MSGRVMRKFRHAGKKGVKFRFSATLERLVVEGTRSWQPHKLAVVWTRRKRRNSSSLQSWRPGIENPYKGAVEWSKLNPETVEVEVTLFKDARRGLYETKDWVFVLENEAKNGKRKAIATFRIDMAEQVTDVPSPRPLHIRFKPLTSKLSMASLALMIKCEFLKEGAATDPDMASVVGSTTSDDTIRLGGVDVCDFTDFDDMDVDGSSKRSGSLNSRGSSTKNQLLELTQQIEMFSKGFKDEDAKPDGNANVSATNSLKSSGRKPSTSGSIAEKSSIASFKSGKESGDEKKSTEENRKEKIKASTEENNRNSSASESAASEPSPVQKRRLLPSTDVVPLRQTDTTIHHSTPTSYGSPASELHRPLLKWCQVLTEGYRGVKVTNFTTSWRNGLAFCAVLHRITPDTVAYADLKPLDGRENLKKAFQGFRDLGLETDEISKALRTSSGGVATKAIVISFLNEVKQYFDEHNLDDTIEILRKEKTERRELLKNKRPSLSDFMREKLLSDLEEREGEDDVFSCELEEALEKETGPDVLHLSVIEDSLDISGETTSHLLMQGTEFELSTRLSTITESPCTPKSAKVEDERTNSFMNPIGSNVDETHRDVNGGGDVETSGIDEALNPFSVDISEFDSSTPVVKESELALPEKTKKLSPNGIIGSEEEKNTNMSDTSPLPDSAAEFERPLLGSKNNLPPYHAKLKQPTEVLTVVTTVEEGDANDVKVEKEEFSVEKTLSDVASLIDSMQKENENPTPTSVDQLPSTVEQTSYSTEDLQTQTNEKPMTEKRAKALALIEQFKAQSEGKNEDWKTMSLSRDFGNKDGKRREEVRERARRLIEKTRVSLDIKPSPYTHSTECLQLDPELNEVATCSDDKYSTLPSGKYRLNEEKASASTEPETKASVLSDLDFITTHKTEPEPPNDEVDSNFKDARSLSEHLPAVAKSSEAENLLISSKPIIPDVSEALDYHVTQNISVESSTVDVKQESVREEVDVPHVNVLAVSPTKVSSFSEFSNIFVKTPMTEPTEEEKEVEIMTKEIQNSGDNAPLSESLDVEVLTELSKPADFNGNAVKNQDSRYFMIGSEENLIVSPSKEKPPQEQYADLRFKVAEAPETKLAEKTEDLSNTVEISLSDVGNSISVLTLSSPQGVVKKADPIMPDTAAAPTPHAARDELEIGSNDTNVGSKPANLGNTSSIIKDCVEQETEITASIHTKDDVASTVKIEDKEMQGTKSNDVYGSSKSSDPLTPLRADPLNLKKFGEPITSTPVAEQSPVKYRRPKQSNTNGAASPLKETPTKGGSPARVAAPKPVKLVELESFSPILNQGKEEEALKLPRSRPSSVKIARRKSSTSSIRKSIAANDTNPLERERLALEEEMRVVDDRSAEVQEEMQALKNAGRGKSKQREEILMQEWFQLVQKKNAIVRQQDQLLLLEQEHDLGLQVNEINEQMRPYMTIEESQKTEAQKEAEKALLDQLVCLVNERDRIIRTIDENEQAALDDDMHVQTKLDQNMSKVFNQEEEKCAIM